jgi:hypothetical protein
MEFFSFYIPPTILFIYIPYFQVSFSYLRSKLPSSNTLSFEWKMKFHIHVKQGKVQC